MSKGISLIEVQLEDGSRKFGLKFKESDMLEDDEGGLSPVMYMDPDEATYLGVKLVQWGAVELERSQRRDRRRGRG